jgi:hypothetical protein
MSSPAGVPAQLIAIGLVQPTPPDRRRADIRLDVTVQRRTDQLESRTVGSARRPLITPTSPRGRARADRVAVMYRGEIVEQARPSRCCAVRRTTTPSRTLPCLGCRWARAGRTAAREWIPPVTSRSCQSVTSSECARRLGRVVQGGRCPFDIRAGSTVGGRESGSRRPRRTWCSVWRPSRAKHRVRGQRPDHHAREGVRPCAGGCSPSSRTRILLDPRFTIARTIAEPPAVTRSATPRRGGSGCSSC